jgi:hypothetical protein
MSTQLELSAVGENLALDHRVTPDRAAHFFSWAEQPASVSILKDKLTDYAIERVKLSRDPEFLDRDLNSKNVVDEPNITEVGTILDLSGLQVTFDWAKEKGYSLMSDVTVAVSFSDWLSTYLDSDRRASFIADTLDLLNAHRLESPYSLIWCVPWDRLRKVLQSEPSRWLTALGIQPQARTRWLVALRFPVEHVRPLVRPTSLDCGGHLCHFPTPPDTPLVEGGHPVDLRPNHDSQLRPEFIRRPPDYRIEYWVDAGSYCERIDPDEFDVGADLPRARRHHREALGVAYGREPVDRWLRGVD